MLKTLSIHTTKEQVPYFRLREVRSTFLNLSVFLPQSCYKAFSFKKESVVEMKMIKHDPRPLTEIEDEFKLWNGRRSCKSSSTEWKAQFSYQKQIQ